MLDPNIHESNMYNINKDHMFAYPKNFQWLKLRSCRQIFKLFKIS